jgi:hypothetical protein
VPFPRSHGPPFPENGKITPVFLFTGPGAPRNDNVKKPLRLLVEPPWPSVEKSQWIWEKHGLYVTSSTNQAISAIDA